MTENKYRVEDVYGWVVGYRWWGTTRDYSVDTLVDLNTGVVYAVVWGFYEKNPAVSNNYAAMNVQYNTDGTIKVYSKEEVKRACFNWAKNYGEKQTEYVFHIMGDTYAVDVN